MLARQAAPQARRDPVRALDDLQLSLGRLDTALATAQNQEQRLRSAREALEGALFSARSQIAAARAVLDERTGRAGARARLAEAEPGAGCRARRRSGGGARATPSQHPRARRRRARPLPRLIARSRSSFSENSGEIPGHAGGGSAGAARHHESPEFLDGVV